MNSPPTNQPFVFRSDASATVAASGVSTVPTSQQLVSDTRREILEIVREVAMEARGQRPLHDFFAFLADRILRAMAAEGVVIWRQTQQDEQHVILNRLGKITDQTIDVASRSTHDLMIAEVARAGQPVVVPATPGATDPDVPSNPTDVPIAAVPIESDPSAEQAEFLIEVFLDSEGGVATQRGYLRFVAQMGDLAGEYLRAEQLRRFRRSQDITRRVDEAIHRIHQPSDRRKVEAAIVDTAAEVFGFDRVGLCMIDSAHATLAAVSHVNRIDQRSQGARQIRDAAMMELADEVGFITDDDETDPSPSGLVVTPTENASMRLVAFGSDLQSAENQAELQRFAKHANIALRNVTRFDAIPGGKLISALAPALQTSPVRWWIRPVVTVSVLTLLVIVMMFPIPMYVNSPATITPTQIQRVTATRDAIVQQVHVQHGQRVLRDEPLVTLTDPLLDQQITTLLGRRTVLVEKQARWNRMLVDTDIDRRDQIQQLHGEQALVREEIETIDAELEILKSAKASLVLRANRSGTVDAWRIHERLDGRPLSRGDAIAQVIADDTEWVADVRVPQNRVQHIRSSSERRNLVVSIALESTPNDLMSANLIELGPAVATSETGLPANAVRVKLSDEAVAKMVGMRQFDRSKQAGQFIPVAAPSRAVFDCGHQPVLYVLFQDVIRSVRTNYRLYLGSSNQKTHGES